MEMASRDASRGVQKNPNPKPNPKYPKTRIRNIRIFGYPNFRISEFSDNPKIRIRIVILRIFG
ncbi:hypothetical protein Hdeb2414_s0002g00045541 [Helianthus debilis subsp. tardiflorus]